MYEKLEELEQRFEIHNFPLNVIIETGNYCNLNCTTCVNDKLTRKRGHMESLLYRKIIDEIAVENPHVRVWLDFYGEPLLIKYKLYYMISYAKKKGLTNVNLNTNATLLTEEMAEMLLDSEIDFISIDCDGFTKETYEKIRVGADRDKVYKNIEYILKRKKERQCDKTKIEVKIMEMDENKDEIQQVMDYWRLRGAWTTKRRLISWGGQVDNIQVKTDSNRIACGNAVGICPITWDGNVVNCVMDVDAGITWGNVNNTTIKEIWTKRNTEMVQAHMEHRFEDLPLICQKCNDWSVIGEERFDEEGKPIQKNYSHEGSNFKLEE